MTRFILLLPFLVAAVMLVIALVQIARARLTDSARAIWAIFSVIMPIVGPILWMIIGHPSSVRAMKELR